MPAPKLAKLQRRPAAFIEPMQCLSVAKLPSGPLWTWEIKLDGYRALAVRSGKKVTLYSRLKNSLNIKHPYIVEPLSALPDDTVVDGELVALDDDGRPDFHMMQKFRNASARIHYYIFDLLVLRGRDLTILPLSERRRLLKSEIKIRDGRIRIVDYAEADSRSLLAAIRKQGLEGIVGKRSDSVYEAGQRSGRYLGYEQTNDDVKQFHQLLPYDNCEYLTGMFLGSLAARRSFADDSMAFNISSQSSRARNSDPPRPFPVGADG
jgi:ATP-dependent DNA ligase